MKLSVKSAVASLALAAVMAGPASAMISQGDLNLEIGSALSGSSNILAVVNGDTAVLTGAVDGASDANAAVRAALAFDGINNVVDHTFPSK